MYVLLLVKEPRRAATLFAGFPWALRRGRQAADAVADNVSRPPPLHYPTAAMLGYPRLGGEGRAPRLMRGGISDRGENAVRCIEAPCYSPSYLGAVLWPLVGYLKPT